MPALKAAIEDLKADRRQGWEKLERHRVIGEVIELLREKSGLAHLRDSLTIKKQSRSLQPITERKATMQFLAISRMRTDLFSDADFAPLLEDEAQRARTLYIEGAVRQIWHRGDERGACSALEADSEGAAREIIGSLPLVRAGMLELVNLIPLLPYRGFGPRS